MIISGEDLVLAVYYVRYHASRNNWRFRRGIGRLKYRPVWKAYEAMRPK